MTAWFDRPIFANRWAQVADGTPAPALYTYERLDSTNTTLWTLLDTGAATPPALAIARQQQAGRGQWQRTWQSAPGGLYLSLAWTAAEPASPLLTLAIARAIARRLRAEQLPVQLKWPNDLILQGRKLGGLLCESRRLRGQSYLLVGLGLNWANPVPPTGIALQVWQQAQGVQAIADLESLAAIAASSILTGAAQVATAEPATWLADYWQLLAHQYGPVTVQGQSGLAVGIAPDGQLRVRLQAPGARSEICCSPGSVRIDYDSLSEES